MQPPQIPEGGSFDSENSTVSIKVNNLKSKPYINLTLDVMKQFGLNVPENRNYEEFVFQREPINQLTTQPIHYTVEGDWSGGAFFLVAGCNCWTNYRKRIGFNFYTGRQSNC